MSTEIYGAMNVEYLTRLVKTFTHKNLIVSNENKTWQLKRNRWDRVYKQK